MDHWVGKLLPLALYTCVQIVNHAQKQTNRSPLDTSTARRLEFAAIKRWYLNDDRVGWSTKHGLYIIVTKCSRTTAIGIESHWTISEQRVQTIRVVSKILLVDYLRVRLVLPSFNHRQELGTSGVSVADHAAGILERHYLVGAIYLAVDERLL